MAKLVQITYHYLLCGQVFYHKRNGWDTSEPPLTFRKAIPTLVARVQKMIDEDNDESTYDTGGQGK